MWSLYRGLLREAPGKNIQFRVAVMFRKKRGLTSPDQTREKLLLGYKWLETFKRAKEGDERMRSILRRYERMIECKRKTERLKTRFIEEQVWQEKLYNRPILTGSYHRPTLYNRALPQLKPQPESITMMIHKRRIARERRLAKFTHLGELRDDIRKEMEFEKRLRKEVSAFGGEFEGYVGEDVRVWDEPLKSERTKLLATFKLDGKRQTSQYPAELLESIKQARRNKIENKTRELERERKGEVLRRTILRRRRGPPAHVLGSMTQRKREMDRVARSVSEVGYVGLVKRRMGFRIKSGYDPEEGKTENRDELEDTERAIRLEMRTRRDVDTTN